MLTYNIKVNIDGKEICMIVEGAECKKFGCTDMIINNDILLDFHNGEITSIEKDKTC